MNAQQGAPACADLAAQATAWFVRNRQGPLSAQEKADLLMWLQGSPEHVRAYLRVLQLHGDVGAAMARPVRALASATQVPAARGKVVSLFGEAPAPSVPDPAHRYRRRVVGMAAAAGLVAIGIATLPVLWPQTQVYSAAHGQVRELRLADNTQLRLNADTEVRVRMGWLARRVELLRGEASFDIAPGRRPFRVQVDGLEIRDIGTVFDVSRRLQDTRVGVVSGAVEVWSGVQGQRLAQLTAGEVVKVSHGSHAVHALDVSAEQLLDWQRGKISFTDERLDEVAAAFNRHNRIQVVVEDETAAAARLSGSLDANHIGALHAVLVRDPRFIVRRSAEQIRIAAR